MVGALGELEEEPELLDLEEVLLPMLVLGTMSAVALLLVLVSVSTLMGCISGPAWLLLLLLKPESRSIPLLISPLALTSPSI